jgi:hypothetical protein
VKRRQILPSLAVIGLILLITFAGIAYAKKVTGTKGNDWGPLHEHPSWPLPDDCGSKRLGSIPHGGVGNDKVHGSGGCDYLRGGAGNDHLWGGKEMDTIYGGTGNDVMIGRDGHDHLFGEEGNDFLGTRDGNNEPGNKEEVRGGPGKDRCWLSPDSDGIKMNSCEILNGSRNPFPVGKYINTEPGGTQADMRKEVNRYLSRHK